MILDTDKTTVTSVGDIQENQVGIDPSNIEHIVTILSSNLYSDPEKSFLRETISNAYDSHIEAGTENEPIILSVIENSYDNYTISIRDYGTGISPERFKEIYLCIGSSTKRANNQYIGAFGVGRFSALACSNIVHITSYYNGTAYYYLMVRNGSKINIDTLSITDTKEKNGVEVKIDNITDLYKYRQAISSLYYFKTLFIHTNTEYTELASFNTRKILTKDNFYLDDKGKSGYYWERTARLVLGSVVYDYDISKTNFCSNNDCELLKNIVLKFSIGELEITPNREALLYSDKTVQALNARIDAAYNELRGYYKESISNIDDILDYYKVVSAKGMHIEGYILPKDALRCTDKILYKGSQHFKHSSIAWTTLYSIATSSIAVLPIKMVIWNGVIMDTPTKNKKRLIDLLTDFRFLIVPSETKFRSTLLRGYLQDNYGDKTTIVLASTDNSKVPSLHPSLSYFSSSLQIPYINYLKDNPGEAIYIVNEFKRFIKKYGETVDIENSDSYKQYCESQKSTPRIPNTTSAKTIRFYCTYFEDYYERNYKADSRSIDALKSREKWMFKEHKIVIFGSLDNKLWDLFRLFYPTNQKNNNYVLVKVANSNFNKIKELPNGWLRVEDLINAQNPHFINIMTIHKYKSTLTCDYEYLWDRLRKLAVVLPHTDKELVLSALKYRYSYNVNTSYYEALNLLIPEYKKLGSRCNRDIIDSFKCANKYLNILSKIQKWFNVVTNIDFIAFLAMKHKLFRINYTTYKNIKDNLNLIEDENS